LASAQVLQHPTIWCSKEDQGVRGTLEDTVWGSTVC